MNLDIVIVNWNSGTQLRECVDSIFKYDVDLVAQVVIVDNGSTDGSILKIEARDRLNIIEAGANLGFGKACNLGASFCDSEFILFLNPDTRVYSKTLGDVLNFFTQTSNDHVGICGIQLDDQNGTIAKSCSRFPSAIRLISSSLGLDKIAPCLGSAMSDCDHSSTMLVDQVIGAFFLVRRSLFDSLNGFDERFFIYYEEVDFSFRAKEYGWKSVYFAGAQAFHLGGGVSRQVKAKRIFYSKRSAVQYTYKHFGVFEIVIVCSAILFIEPLCRIIQALMRRSLSSLRETIVGYYLLYRWSLSRCIRFFSELSSLRLKP